MASQHSTGRKSKSSARPSAPKRKPDRAGAAVAVPEGYFEWSRDPAVGLFVIMPLWLTYEVLRQFFVPRTMNLAEYWVKEQFYTLPRVVLDVYSIAVALAVAIAAWSLLRRQIPWVRVGLVVVLEGSVYGLMLGPIAAQLTRHSMPVLELNAVDGPLFANLIGSLGAGVFEELVFRLVLLSGLAWLFVRALKSFHMHRSIAIGLALLASSLLFSLFHHVGVGLAELEPKVFVFRAMAGIQLGILFITRGLGVCVYTHAMYDVFYYLSKHE
ncbi:MAG: CPBP family glutamic-type intramembrane protease [Planctomycetota bacterium]|nr:CPBP family glutamic-type intramembrane protease [Planctomycetota bacterium]